MDLTQNSGGYNSSHDSTTPTPMNLAPPIGGRGGTSPLASPTAQMQRPSLRVVIPQSRSPHPDEQVSHTDKTFNSIYRISILFIFISNIILLIIKYSLHLSLSEY